MRSSLQLWDLDSLNLWVVVSVFETLTVKSVVLHSNVVESADGIDIWSSSKSLKLFLGLVEIKDFLDAIEVLSDIVFMLKNTKGSLNLIFVHFFFSENLFNKL